MLSGCSLAEQSRCVWKVQWVLVVVVFRGEEVTNFYLLSSQCWKIHQNLTLVLHLLQDPRYTEMQQYLGIMIGVSLFHLGLQSAEIQTGIISTPTRSMRPLLGTMRF